MRRLMAFPRNSIQSRQRPALCLSTKSHSLPEPTTTSAEPLSLNLSAATLEELQALIVDAWGFPKFRAKQVYQWIRSKGITEIDEMNNIPKVLREQLHSACRSHALEVADEWIAKDGTVKRAYRCVDGQLIESVLMGYTDGRYTACISSQAGCAQKCTFCATGQMGFARQLTSDEIFEQVARFHSDLLKANKRLSNIVFMGMGEPLANYKQVKRAVQRITDELGIGARRITISTVGIVPMIRKLANDPEMPNVKLAVSLHCADDASRDTLMPVNIRYGGLDELFDSLREYMLVTKQRITMEWALIQGENDNEETAHKLGKLLHEKLDRSDLVHINVIPLNPTGAYAGKPSNADSVNTFCSILETEYKIPCTPRVRRGIDINAGCGQLKASILKREQKEEENSTDDVNDTEPNAVDIDSEEFENTVYESEDELAEAQRLLSLVENTYVDVGSSEPQTKK